MIMNRPESSKYVPGLPADDDIDTPTNAPVDDSIKIYDGVAECTMNDADTLKSVKSRAKDLAIQKVQQKIADYVYGFWKDRYLTLPDDEVLSIANEICTITDVKYNAFDSDNNILIRATILAQIDDNDVMNYIIQFFKERNEFKNQNEDLKRQIAELTQQIISKDKIALSNQKNNEADKLRNKSDYESAIKLYSEAIKLNPNAYYLYENRGECYQILKQYEQAIKDYSEAIELHPYISNLYKMRGECYRVLGNDEKAKTDFNKAGELGL